MGEGRGEGAGRHGMCDKGDGRGTRYTGGVVLLHIKHGGCVKVWS